MKSNVELLEMYKEEKATVIGSLSQRTGLESFPTFAEWKDEYVREYNETHDVLNPVTMEEAVAMLDNEPDNDLLDDEALEALAADEECETEDKEDTMSETETTNAAVEAAPETTEAPTTKPKRTAKKSASKKTTAKKSASSTKKVAAKGPSKAAQAQKVFDRLYPKVKEGKKTRKDVITELTEKCSLTANGAQTYYQKMKKVADAA